MGSPYEQVDSAYQKGKRARRKGLLRKENPHNDAIGTVQRRVRGAWDRGWLSENSGRILAVNRQCR